MAENTRKTIREGVELAYSFNERLSDIEKLEEDLKQLRESILIYGYFYAENDTITFPLVATDFNLLEFSSKGLSSYLASVELIPDSVKDSKGNAIFSGYDQTITLYQTGAEEDIATERYGYDTYIAKEKKIVRYCLTLTFRELFDMFPSTLWSWSKTSGNGRLTIRYDSLAAEGIYCQNGFKVKAVNPHEFEFAGVGSVNFGISNLLSTNPGITKKSEAIATLLDDEFKDTVIVFKRTIPSTVYVSSLELNTPSIECDGIETVSVSGFGGCIKSSYLSFNSLIYTKDQTDSKFLTKEAFNEDNHILKIGNVEATDNVYASLQASGYPKFASATFVPPTDGETYSCPFSGYSFLINQRIGDESPYEYGYIVISNKKVYWLTNSDGVDSIIDLIDSQTPYEDLNIQNGAGTNAIQQKQDGTSGTFDFTNKNPNATALDPTLTGEIAYGGVGNFATSFGGKSQASGKRSLAEGTTTIAKGNYSHAEGDNSVSYGHDSHAEGYATLSAGLASHTEGTKTQVLTTLPESGGGGDTPVDPPSGFLPDDHRGEASHAEGSLTAVYGFSSHAEGANTIVKGHYAHAEGVSTMAVGAGSKSYGDHTTANGDYSVAGGSYTTANQICSFAHGYGASTYAEYSTAFGDNTQTVRRAQFATGVYNVGKTTTLFEVGNGASNSRNNAFEVYEDGHAEVGLMGSTNLSVATKGYVDGKVSSITIKEINEADITPELLQEIYNEVPEILRVNSVDAGIQDYGLKVNNKSNDNISYACVIYGTEFELQLEYKNGAVTLSANTLNFMPSEFDGNLYTAQEVDSLLSNKQNTLVSGTNIKTINNQSILGSGNIEISGGSGTDKYLSNAELTTSEIPSETEKEVLFSSLDTANANFSLLPNNRSFWTTYDDYMKAIEGTKLEEITLVAGTAGNVRFYGYNTAIPYNQITNNLALAAQRADSNGYLLMTINVEVGTKTYKLDGTDSRVTISNQTGINSCPPCLGISRTGDTGLLKYNSANITGEPYRHWTHAGLSGSTIETPDPTNALPILFKVSTSTSETKTELVLTMNDGTEHKVVMNEVDVGSTIESVYKGKTLSILGDSISTFSGQIPTGNATYYPRGDVSTVNNTWWKKLADALGMTILVNNSWSGSWVTTVNSDASAGCMTRCQSLHSGNVDPDVIIVWMGINDFNNEAALGTYDGKSAVPSDTTKFREAYAIMLNKILTRYKTSEIWVCTLPQMERNNDAGFPEINENGVALKDFNDAIVELADAFGVKILDHNKAGMTYQNMDTYTVDWDSSTSKGLHPNNAGHSLIANNDIRQMDNAVRKRY